MLPFEALVGSAAAPLKLIGKIAPWLTLSDPETGMQSVGLGDR
jgi:hypothetical protein